jgi:hypothetical protein
MNAMRHGLTGRVVVLPSEDMNAYRAFCEHLLADLAPETALERQYANRRLTRPVLNRTPPSVLCGR